MEFEDSTKLAFGNSSDVTVAWDGTDLDILAAADDSIIKFGTGTNSFDMWWYGDAPTNTVKADAGANTLTLDDVDLYMGDNDIIALGDSQDVTMRWDATDLDILAAADDSVIKFGTGTNSFDIWMYGNTIDTYVLWDASADTMELQDSTKLALGTSTDVTLAWDGTDLDVVALADDQVWKWGQATTAWDMWWYGNGADDNIIFDASANEFAFDGVDVSLEDADLLKFGDSDDVTINWDGTDMDVLAAADDSVIKFGTGTNSFDIWLYGNAPTTYVEWDASADTMEFQDSTLLGFGAASDVTMRWDGTDLDILAAADDSVIKFGTGTNSFDVWWYGSAPTSTLVGDASADTVTFDGIDAIFNDDDKIRFGDALGTTDMYYIEYDEDGHDDLIIHNGTNEFLVLKAQTTAEASLSVNGWIRPYVEGTAPDAVDPTNPTEGAIAVDTGEQDCFAAADGTDGGSLCVYSGAAWVVAQTW